MKQSLVLAAGCLALASCAAAQMGRTTDWWTFAGDAQRDGWEKNEQRFLKDDVKNFAFLWEMKLDHSQKGVRSLAAPVVWGNLIGSRGFKELAFVESSSGDLWSIDADLARIYWEHHPAGKHEDGACSNFATTPSLPAPVVFRFRRNPTPPAVAQQPKIATAPSGATPGKPLVQPPPEAPAPPPSAMNAAFRVRPVWFISNDGRLHAFNIDDGSDMHPDSEFIPAGKKTRSINMSENTLYASAGSCKGGKDAAVYAIDTTSPQSKPVVFETQATSIEAIGNPAISASGMVYVQTGKGSFKPEGGKFGRSLVALAPKTLEVKDYINLPSNTAPVAFTFKGRELVAAAGSDGRIYLLDAHSLGGSDHKTALFRSDAFPALWGGLSTWEQTDGTRYVLATVWGKRGVNPNGSVVAFKIQENAGKLSLAPVWTSPDLLSPDPPVIAQGVVFVLANGKYGRKMHVDPSSHATIYALDALSGQVLWSTGDQIKQPGALSGLTIANSRLYVTTIDNTVHVFGKYMEIEQH